MKDYIEDTFDDIESHIYGVLGRINALRMDIHGTPSKPWVSLTDEEIGLLSTNNTFSGMHPDYLRECVCAIEAKLKEKNHGN